MQFGPRSLPAGKYMIRIDVATLRSTLERPSGGYFSPGLEQRLEPKRLVLASVFQAASSLFWQACLSERDKPQARKEHDIIPNYVLNCGDNVARRPTIDEGAHGLYLAGSWIGQCRM